MKFKCLVSSLCHFQFFRHCIYEYVFFTSLFLMLSATIYTFMFIVKMWKTCGTRKVCDLFVEWILNYFSFTLHIVIISKGIYIYMWMRVKWCWNLNNITARNIFYLPLIFFYSHTLLWMIKKKCYTFNYEITTEIINTSNS